MPAIRYTFWGSLALLTVLWIAAEPRLFAPTGFFGVRAAMTQYSGIVAMGCMSLAMILALRSR